MTGTANIRRDVAACLVLIAITLAGYWQVLGHGFVNFDDPLYVTGNHTVQAGLSAKGVAWALTTGSLSNWHPSTWLSHMLDCTLFGLRPWGHHLTSLLFHIANTLLLYAFFRRTTRETGKSLFVAALFAVHPLHVESVAWVSERKDVLSTFFMMLALIAYARYADKTTPARYAVVALSFALGLMAKPMLVTLPFVFLLVDVWPLRRIAFDRETLAKRVVEKLPLFALSAASSAVTLLAQRQGGALGSLEHFSLHARAGNALLSYALYAVKTLWPSGLAVYYPHAKEAVPLWHAAGAAIALVCVSVFAVRRIRECPWLAMGWLWYAGTLFPVIGIVQVGGQAMADRYAYVPLTGLFVCAAWGVPMLLRRKTALAVAAVAVTIALTALTWHQVGYWENSRTLFEHALETTNNNGVAHYNLGCALLDDRELDGAVHHFREALEVEPDNAEYLANLGMALGEQGKKGEAIELFHAVLRLQPDHVNALTNLGAISINLGAPGQAIEHLSKAARLDPGDPDVQYNLGAAMLRQGRTGEALAHLAESVRLNPNAVSFRRLLARQLLEQGRADEAASHLSEIVRLEPGNVKACLEWGIALASLGRFAAAETAFSRALEIQPQHPGARFNLANALLRQDKHDEAVRQFSEYLRAKPNDADAHFALGLTLAKLGRNAEAAAQFLEAVRLKPDHVQARQYVEQLED